MRLRTYVLALLAALALASSVEARVVQSVQEVVSAAAGTDANGNGTIRLSLVDEAAPAATCGTANGTGVVATGTLAAGAGVVTKHGSLVATAFDGHTTPMDLFMNFAVPDADSSASDTLTVAGTIKCTWTNSGDY